MLKIKLIVLCLDIHMRTIAISNNKGGVGKTTSTVNIAAALEILGKRVLVIDMDPQSHTTYHLGFNPEELKLSVFEVLQGERYYDEVLIHRGNIDLLPARPNLKDIDFIPFPAKEFLLKEALADVHEYDYLLIDCPPSLGILTLNALTFSEEIFIPLQCEFLSFQGMYNLYEGVQMVKKRLNKGIRITGIIGTMYDKRKKSDREIIEETKDRLPTKLFATLIRENEPLKVAPSWGKTIFEFKPECAGAEDYMNLTREIVAGEA